MEDIFDILGYIIVILFAVVPRILKWLAKKGSEPNKSEAPQKPKKPKVDLEEMIEEALASGGEENTISVSELNSLKHSVDEKLARTSQLADTAKNRIGFPRHILDVLDKKCVTPLESHEKRLRSLQQSRDLPLRDEVLEIRQSTESTESVIKIVETIVERRTKPATAESTRILDIAAQECLAPYIRHARVTGIQYPTEQVLAISGIPGEDLSRAFRGTNICPAVVLETAESRTETWVNIPSDIGLDFVRNVPGLERRLAMGLRVLPPPLTFTHYRETNAFIAGLLGGWLGRISGDVAAGLQLGPGFAAGLSRWRFADTVNGDPLTTKIGDSREGYIPPLHIRMFVACRVLQHLGFTEEGARQFREWTEKIGSPNVIRIISPDGLSGSIPVDQILLAVRQAVDFIVEEPIEQLGGIPFSAIPSLRSPRETFETMDAVAMELKEGIPVDALAPIIIGAAQLATLKTPTREQHIAHASFQSIAGKGKPIHTAAPTEGSPSGLADVFSSRRPLIRAIVTGAALAPRPSLKRGALGIGEKNSP